MHENTKFISRIALTYLVYLRTCVLLSTYVNIYTLNNGAYFRLLYHTTYCVYAKHAATYKARISLSVFLFSKNLRLYLSVGQS